MKTVFCTFVSAAVLSLNVQAANIDFSQAWYQVAQKNDSLQAKKEEVKQSEAMQQAAKSLYLPNVDITGSFTHFDNPVEIDTSAVGEKLGSEVAKIAPNLPPEMPAKLAGVAGMIPSRGPLSMDNFGHS